MTVNREALSAQISKIVELGVPVGSKFAGIVGRHERTSRNPGATICFIKEEKRSSINFLSGRFASLDVLVDAAEGEVIHEDARYILDGERNAKKSLVMGIFFDGDGNVNGYGEMMIFLHDKEGKNSFRVDYFIDPTDPTKGIKNKGYTAFNQDHKLIQKNIPPLPESVLEEVDLAATLEMLVFDKHPNGDTVDADMLGSAQTMVVPWSETHPSIAT